MEILDRVKEDFGKAEVTQLREALQTLRELLMKAECRLQGAKRRTKELLNHNSNDWEGRALEDHGRQVEFNKRRVKLMTMIVLAEGDAPTEEAAPCKEAASDNKEQRPDEGTTPTVSALRTVAACKKVGQNDASS